MPILRTNSHRAFALRRLSFLNSYCFYLLYFELVQQSFKTTITSNHKALVASVYPRHEYLVPKVLAKKTIGEDNREQG
jgi:hypothetical protein